MNKTKLKLLVSLPLSVTGKVISLGTAELFFSLSPPELFLASNMPLILKVTDKKGESHLR